MQRCGFVCGWGKAKRLRDEASAKELQRLGETRVGGAPARFRGILERIHAAADGSASREAASFGTNSGIQVGMAIQMWPGPTTSKFRGGSDLRQSESCRPLAAAFSVVSLTATHTNCLR